MIAADVPFGNIDNRVKVSNTYSKLSYSKGQRITMSFKILQMLEVEKMRQRLPR